MCVWFDKKRQNKEARHREVTELSEADLTNLTHGEDITASGGRMRDRKDSNTKAQVSQDSGFPAVVGNCQYFMTRPSNTREGKYTLVCREYTLLWSNPDSKSVCAVIFCALLCALAQSWI